MYGIYVVSRLLNACRPLDVKTYDSYLSILVSFGYEIAIDREDNVVTHDVFKKILTERIIQKAYGDCDRRECKADGKFRKGNRCAERIHIEDEEVYLLYMVYGSKAVTAEKLGVCRQTVYRRIKNYEKEHGKIWKWCNEWRAGKMQNRM